MFSICLYYNYYYKIASVSEILFFRNGHIPDDFQAAWEADRNNSGLPEL